MLLHPGFYYPDVRVHALFAWQLARRGLVEFLRDFTANQYRYSLGLQFESGHWYAFPYPPAFYLMTWPLTAWARFRPEVAVSLVAAVANSLEVIAVFAIARRLRPVGPHERGGRRPACRCCRSSSSGSASRTSPRSSATRSTPWCCGTCWRGVRAASTGRAS
jgi:hypothetical protein